MRTFLIISLVIILILYSGYVTLFYRQQTNMIYPAQGRESTVLYPGTLMPGLTEATYTYNDVEGFAWYLSPQPQVDQQPAIIIAHGNGEISDDWLDQANNFRQRGYHVLLLEYPGYGRAPGSPSKPTIQASAIGGYDWLITQPGVDPAHIYLFGHSIGGAAVTSIAAERDTQGMILLSPFASLRRLARERYLPPFLVQDPFDNLSVVRHYSKPLLLMHGTEDTLIPYAHSETLHQAASQSDLLPLNCGHGGCISDWEAFWDRIDLFIAQNSVEHGA